MLRIVSAVIAVAVLALPTTGAVAAKRHAKPIWHGYGFLPGYRSPEKIERKRAGPGPAAISLAIPGTTFTEDRDSTGAAGTAAVSGRAGPGLRSDRFGPAGRKESVSFPQAWPAHSKIS
jgi:hypothetical protein